MQSSFTGVNLNRTFYLLPRYSSLVCVEVICSDNRHPILTKYSLNLFAISSGLVTARLPMKNGLGISHFVFLCNVSLIIVQACFILFLYIANVRV